MKAVYVLPKFQMNLAKEHPEEMLARLNLFMSCLDEDSESVLRASLGNVRTWSFKRHKYLFYRFVLVYCLADGAILDEHLHFTHDTASEHAAFIKSITSNLDLVPIARGPKAHKRADPSRPSNLMFFARKCARLRLRYECCHEH